MLRVAASMGLKPAEFRAMTYREFELYAEGHGEFWDRVMQLCAWMQANLMNVHLSKGSKVTPEKLLPRRSRARASDAGASFGGLPVGPADMKDAMRAARDRAWWKTEEGERTRRRLVAAGLRSESAEDLPED